MRTRNKPFEKAYSVWSHGANLSKEVGEFENKEQTAQKGQETFRNSSKPLQTAKREEEKLKERSKPLEYLKTKNTPLEKDQEIQNKEQTALSKEQNRSKETRDLATTCKPLAKSWRT